MRALVVGASGFLGGHAARRLHAAGVEVVTAGRRPAGAAGPDVVMDLVVDTQDRLVRVLEDVAADVVVNCAGATTGPVEVLAESNVTGTARLLGAWLGAGERGRLVHLGSAAEYGRTEEGTSVAESDPARPVSAYGATKLAGTRLVELARAHGADAVVLRVFNPIGVGAPVSGLPGRLMAELRRTEVSVPIELGPLGDVRDFVDARDVADAVLRAATVPELHAGVLNVGSGRARAVRALVDALVSTSGTHRRVVESAEGSARSAGAPWQQADTSLTACELGWKAEHDVVASVRHWWEATS